MKKNSSPACSMFGSASFSAPSPSSLQREGHNETKQTKQNNETKPTEGYTAQRLAI